MQAVAQRTGVPPDTLRSWERRHGFPEPSRTGTNRRLYSERDIAAIAWLRDQISRGQGTAEAVRMLRTRLHRAEAEPSVVATPEPVRPPATPAPLDALIAALRDGRLADALRAWDRLALAASVESLCADVLLPADRALRETFADGGLTRPAVRRARAFLLRKATVLLDHAGPDEGTPTTRLVAADDGMLAATVLAVLLARTGAAVVTPVADLSLDTVALIQDAVPDRLVVVGIAASPHLPASLQGFLGAIQEHSAALWCPDGAPRAGVPSAVDVLPADPRAAVAALLRQ